MAPREAEVAFGAGPAVEAGYAPQTHKPAAAAQLDFLDLWVAFGRDEA